MIEFNTLGQVNLLDCEDGRQLLSVLAQPKRVGFFTYLAVASPRGIQSRDTLLGIFWPDSSDKRARNALSQTLFVLRRAVGTDLFTVNGDAGICLNREHLRCDVWEFERALESGEKEEALDLYRGNFLDGFFLPGCLDFERWVDSERSRLRDLATGAVLALSQEMESAGNPVGAVGWLRRARDWAAYDELVLCRQIELLLALGDRSGAVREYESFARRLSVDLGLEPSEDARDLLNRPPEPPPIWRSGSVSGEDTLGPLPLGPAPSLSAEGRGSLLRTLAVAFMGVVLGVSAAVSGPRLWSAATAASGPNAVRDGAVPNVMVLPLENATGNPRLDPLGQTVADEIVQELATTGLARVGPVAVTGEASGNSGGQIAGAGEAANRPFPLRNPKYVVTGSYSARDGTMTYRSRILEVESGTIVVAVDTVMGPLADPGEATERLKRRVAGALAMVLDPRLSELAQVASHPQSLEAYRLLADGLDLLSRAYQKSAGPTRTEVLEAAAAAFLRAAAYEEDSTLPLVFFLEAIRSVTYTPRPDWVLKALRPRRDNLPRWERAMVDYHIAHQAMDFEGQYRAMRGVVGMSSDSEWRYRLAEAAVYTNRPREALELATALEQERHRLQSEAFYWSMRVNAELLLGDYEAALMDIRRSRQLPSQAPSMAVLEITALIRMGRVEEALQRSIDIIGSTGRRGTWHLRYYLPKIFWTAGFEVEARMAAEEGLASILEIEGIRAEYVAEAFAWAGRFDEARRVLGHPVLSDSVASKSQAYSLLAYMAAREGNADEAVRLSELAVTGAAEFGVPRSPFGVMSQAEVAAHLGDNAGAVRFLREAYGLGLPHGSYIFTRWDLRPLQGYQPFEDLMRPKG